MRECCYQMDNSLLQTYDHMAVSNSLVPHHFQCSIFECLSFFHLPFSLLCVQSEEDEGPREFMM